MAVSPATNKIYVANYDSNDVSVIDGATNTVTRVADPNATSPIAVAVNPITNKVYVANYASTNITVIDGATNSISTVRTGSQPYAVAVNPVSNKIYVANWANANVTVIDGVTRTTTTVGAGTQPFAVGINPMTGKIYVANIASGNITVITEQQVRPIPLVTAITPVMGNRTTERTPIFVFSVSSSFAPIAPPPRGLYYQVDTWQMPWLAASGVPPNFKGELPRLSLGPHILYAFASDAQDANSTGAAQLLIGRISAYMFHVVRAETITYLEGGPYEIEPGETVSFFIGVQGDPEESYPTGTVTLYDGQVAMDTIALDYNAEIFYYTDQFSAGEHEITARYNGDTNYLGSTSDSFPLRVGQPKVKPTPSSLSFGKQLVGTTSGVAAVRVANSGLAPLNISWIAASGDFNQSNNCPHTLAAGAFCTIKVAFTPTTINKRTGAITLNDDAADSPQTVPLTGVGTIVSVLPTNLNFGTLTVGQQSAPKTVTLTNRSSTTAVIISSTTITGTAKLDYSIVANTCTGTINPLRTCAVTVVFKPTLIGRRPGTLNLFHNGGGSPSTVGMVGFGQ